MLNRSDSDSIKNATSSHKSHKINSNRETTQRPERAISVARNNVPPTSIPHFQEWQRWVALAEPGADLDGLFKIFMARHENDVRSDDGNSRINQSRVGGLMATNISETTIGNAFDKWPNTEAQLATAASSASRSIPSSSRSLSSAKRSSKRHYKDSKVLDHERDQQSMTSSRSNTSLFDEDGCYVADDNQLHSTSVLPFRHMDPTIPPRTNMDPILAKVAQRKAPPTSVINNNNNEVVLDPLAAVLPPFNDSRPPPTVRSTPDNGKEFRGNRRKSSHSYKAGNHAKPTADALTFSSQRTPAEATPSIHNSKNTRKSKEQQALTWNNSLLNEDLFCENDDDYQISRILPFGDPAPLPDKNTVHAAAAAACNVIQSSNVGNSVESVSDYRFAVLPKNDSFESCSAAAASSVMDMSSSSQPPPTIYKYNSTSSSSGTTAPRFQRYNPTVVAPKQRQSELSIPQITSAPPNNFAAATTTPAVMHAIDDSVVYNDVGFFDDDELLPTLPDLSEDDDGKRPVLLQRKEKSQPAHSAANSFPTTRTTLDGGNSTTASLVALARTSTPFHSSSSSSSKNSGLSASQLSPHMKLLSLQSSGTTLSSTAAAAIAGLASRAQIQLQTNDACLRQSNPFHWSTLAVTCGSLEDGDFDTNNNINNNSDNFQSSHAAATTTTTNTIASPRTKDLYKLGQEIQRHMQIATTCSNLHAAATAAANDDESCSISIRSTSSSSSHSDHGNRNHNSSSSNNNNKNKNSAVRFSDPLVTRVTFRSMTDPADIEKLFFVPEELRELERDRDMTATDQVECSIAAAGATDQAEGIPTLLSAQQRQQEPMLRGSTDDEGGGHLEITQERDGVSVEYRNKRKITIHELLRMTPSDLSDY